MYGHQWSQAITAFATRACDLAKKSHMLNFCEGLRGLRRNMMWLWSIETNNARNKKEQSQKTKKIITTFGKSLFLIEYSIYMPPNTKDLAINQTMVAYENQQNATTFARANNFDLLRSLKHSMETRLKSKGFDNIRFQSLVRQRTRANTRVKVLMTKRMLGILQRLIKAKCDKMLITKKVCVCSLMGQLRKIFA